MSDGASVSSYSSCMIQSNDIAAVENLIFDHPLLWEGVTLGSTMVLLGWAMVRSHRLSVQTNVVSVTVWPQFSLI